MSEHRSWISDTWGKLNEQPKTIVDDRSQLIHEESRIPEFIKARRAFLDGVHLPSGATLLEVGCGPVPYVDVTLEKLGPSGKWIGIDSTHGFVEESREILAARGATNGEFISADARSLPVDDGIADAVIADKILIHVAPIEQAISEMVRVAKPGAWLGACDSDSDGLLVHASDLELTRRILRYNGDQRASPKACCQTAAAFHKLGLTNVHRRGFLSVMSDPNEPFVPHIIRHWADRAALAGVVDQEEADRWYHDAMSQTETNSLMVAFPLILTFGQKS
jgi:ubiquinone/menaquinone biosynthesis C-methylase UbiE